MPDEVTNNGTTETRILITEDKHGNLKVNYEMIMQGTEVAVPFRFSHLVGQIFVAMIIVIFQGYKKIFRPSEESNSKAGEGKSDKDKKIPKAS